MKKLIYIFSLPILLACEDDIQLDVAQADQKIIIQAQVTNRPDYQFVKISKTVGFYDNGISPGVNNAVVSVEDDLGTSWSFSESTDDEGVYLPDVNFVGEVGRTYTLSVEVEGKQYSSTEELMPITPVDSLTSVVNPERMEEYGPNADVYDVLLYTVEPQDQENFYLFKFYSNGNVLNDDGEDITVTDDVAVGEAIDGLELPEHHSLGDSVSIEMFSLTKTSFIYWNDVASLIFSDGGIFSPLPANPRSNISGGALGVFQVSGVSVGYVIVEN